MQQFEKELATVIAKKASDLYVLPVAQYYRLQVAVGGQLTTLKEVPRDYGERLIAFLKYRADMAVSEHRRPQLGAFTWQQGALAVNLRLSTVGDYQGRESLVIRFIYQLSQQEFNFIYPHQWRQMKDVIRKRGMFLFAGPMGVGKTTTMYHLAQSMLPEKVVLTIEDPVEIAQPAFIQLQVNELAGMDYQSLLRLGLRHRPDVFIIGEIRDPQTAAMAIQAALSGHLVMGTIHARNVYGAVARLAQLGVERYFIEQALSGICYQRLLPTCDGQSAVMCDLLTGVPLHETIIAKKGGQMTDEWTKGLKEAARRGKITAQVAAEYYDG